MVFPIKGLFLFGILFLFLGPIACGSSSSENSVDTSRNARAAVENAATLGEFWDGSASLIESAAGLGSDFNFHFLSAVEEGGELRAYYVLSPSFYGRQPGASTGLATSSDGINFQDHGEVLSVGGDSFATLGALNDFDHPDGRSDDRCRGWSAGREHAGGYLAASREALPVSGGSYRARFALTLFDGSHDETAVALLEVYDKQSGIRISSRDILAEEFPAIGVESSLDLDFILESRKELELRVFSYGVATVCFRSSSVQREASNDRDNRIASFPSVYRDGNGWLMLYEGASDSELGIHGEIRMAASSDGFAWQKEPTPILEPSAPWQGVNIGTPSLLRHQGQWFLFYHGFDGERLQLGVASGSSLENLSPLNDNQPVLQNGEGWDSGTIGKRSILFEEPYFYMVYEGSTLESDFSKASWGTGLARSRDLLNWEKYANNPIIGPTSGGFGYDGPEFIRTPDGTLHIYYRNMLGSTDRVTLVATGE